MQQPVNAYAGCVSSGSGTSQLEPAHPAAVWNGAGSGTAQPEVGHGSAVWKGCGSGTAQPLFPQLSCGGVVTMGSSTTQLEPPHGNAIAAPVPIMSAKAVNAANMETRFIGTSLCSALRPALPRKCPRLSRCRFQRM